MPNVDAPHGFLPVRTKSGNGCITTQRFAVTAANGAMGIGDLIVIDATGLVTARAGAAAAAGTVLGVAAEPKAASSGGTMLVWADDDIVFEGQTDNGTGTATAQTVVGNNIEIVNTAPVAGISQQELDETSAAVTATLPFKVIGRYPVVGNDFGEFNRLEVVLNKSLMKSGGDGGTGI